MAAMLCCAALPAGCATQPVPDMCNPAIFDFYRQIRVAITDASAQAQALQISGAQGAVQIDFDYSGDGKATNIHVTGRSNDDRIQRASLDAVKNATFPPKPAELKDITRFEVQIAVGTKGFEKLARGTVTSGVQVATMNPGAGNSTQGTSGLSPVPSVNSQCQR